MVYDYGIFIYKIYHSFYILYIKYRKYNLTSLIIVLKASLFEIYQGKHAVLQ